MTTHELTPATFVEKWKAVELSERAASQAHFIDLCRLLGQPTPADHDAIGAEYAFEKGISVTGPASKGSKGDYGFADAWWKGKFAWEYKRKDKYKSLDEAYSQLLKYREALENPPLLVVSDIARIQIHTNFTGTAKCVHEITLDQLTDPGCLGKLRRVFTDPDSFKPTQTTEAVTAAVAAQIGYVAQKLRERGHDPHAAAKDAKLKKRTLTNLYNERPTWLRMAHEKLDRAVLAAYAATDPDGDWSEDWAKV